MTQYARWVGSNGIAHTGRVQHGRLQDIPRDPLILDLLAMPADRRRELDVRAGRQQKLPIRDARLAVPVVPARVVVAPASAGSGEAPGFEERDPDSVVPSGAALPSGGAVRAGVARREGRRPGHRARRGGGAHRGVLPARGRTRRGCRLARPLAHDARRARDAPRGRPLDERVSVAVGDEELATAGLRGLPWSFEELLVAAARGTELPAGTVVAALVLPPIALPPETLGTLTVTVLPLGALAHPLTPTGQDGVPR